MTGTKRRVAAAGLLALALALGARVARADDPAAARAACFKAYVDEQALRDKGQLKEARAAAVTCARDVCPALLGRDCMAWMRELEASIPSLAIAVTDGQGSARLDARVTVDGTMVRLDGTSMPLDPGAHTVRAELPGQPAIQATVVLVQGEHDKPVRLVFPSTSSTASSQAVPTLTSSASRPVPTSVYLLGAGTVVALGVWAVSGALALWGSPGNQTLQACYGHCSASDVSEVRARLLVADVAGAASLVLGGAALAFYLGRPLRSDAAPAATGLLAGVSGRF